MVEILAFIGLGIKAKLLVMMKQKKIPKL